MHIILLYRLHLFTVIILYYLPDIFLLTSTYSYSSRPVKTSCWIQYFYYSHMNHLSVQNNIQTVSIKPQMYTNIILPIYFSPNISDTATTILPTFSKAFQKSILPILFLLFFTANIYHCNNYFSYFFH